MQADTQIVKHRVGSELGTSAVQDEAGAASRREKNKRIGRNQIISASHQGGGMECAD